MNLSILFADNKYARLLKNTGIVFLGNVGSKLLTFLMLPFYTKWLSPAEYGTADLITVYTTFLFCIFSCCIQDSIFIYPKGKNFEKQRKYFSSGFFFILSSLLVLALVFFVIYHFFRELPWLSFFNNYIWYIYVYIAVFLLQSYFQQFTRAIDKLVMYSLNGFFLVIITVIASVLWIPKYGVIGYVLALFHYHGQRAGPEGRSQL